MKTKRNRFGPNKQDTRKLYLYFTVLQNIFLYLMFPREKSKKKKDRPHYYTTNWLHETFKQSSDTVS